MAVHRFGPQDLFVLKAQLERAPNTRVSPEFIGQMGHDWISNREALIKELDKAIAKAEAAVGDVDKLSRALVKIRDAAPDSDAGKAADEALKSRTVISTDSVIRHIQKNERKLDVVEIEYAAERWWIRLGTPKDGVVPAVGDDFVSTYGQAIANWEGRKPPQEDNYA